MNFKLELFRKANGMTQKELAMAIHKSIGTIQSWENGTSYPNAESLVALCNLFNVDANTLLGWYDTHPREDTPPLAADESELLDTYRLCTPEWKRNVQMTALSAKGASLTRAEDSIPNLMSISEAM